ncbi:MAG: hypothetical protein M1300_08890 [Epsilonproteobacteria bacterium]|nr:hypothetical protein [Campylobacterota bacterium]
MKILFTFITLVFTLHAQSAKMTAQEHMSIDNGSSRPALQLQKQQQMHRLHKVDEKQLADLVQKETGEAIIREELTHSGDILYYDVRTKSYQLEVNALDGAFLKKVKKDD